MILKLIAVIVAIASVENVSVIRITLEETVKLVWKNAQTTVIIKAYATMGFAYAKRNF